GASGLASGRRVNGRRNPSHACDVPESRDGGPGTSAEMTILPEIFGAALAVDRRSDLLVADALRSEVRIIPPARPPAPGSASAPQRSRASRWTGPATC